MIDWNRGFRAFIHKKHGTLAVRLRRSILVRSKAQNFARFHCGGHLSFLLFAEAGGVTGGANLGPSCKTCAIPLARATRFLCDFIFATFALSSPLKFHISRLDIHKPSASVDLSVPPKIRAFDSSAKSLSGAQFFQGHKIGRSSCDIQILPFCFIFRPKCSMRGRCKTCKMTHSRGSIFQNHLYLDLPLFWAFAPSWLALPP